MEGKELAEHGASSPSSAVVLPTAPTDKINGGEKKLGLPTTNKRTTSSLKSKPKSSSSTLLTREQEYALANTVQAGTHVHKLKAEYESTHSKPLSKREWAQLANMSPNELRKLISDYRTAKQALVSSNMGLVHAIVRSYSRKARYRGVSMDELIQEGSLGLIRAAELFDPARGLRFSTYATIWIKGVLSNASSLEDVITLPNRERVLWNKIRKVKEDIALEGSGGVASEDKAASGGDSGSIGNKSSESPSSHFRGYRSAFGHEAKPRRKSPPPHGLRIERP